MDLSARQPYGAYPSQNLERRHSRREERRCSCGYSPLLGRTVSGRKTLAIGYRPAYRGRSSAVQRAAQTLLLHRFGLGRTRVAPLLVKHLGSPFSYQAAYRVKLSLAVRATQRLSPWIFGSSIHHG